MLMKKQVVSTESADAIFLPIEELGAKHNPHSTLKSGKMEWTTTKQRRPSCRHLPG